MKKRRIVMTGGTSGFGLKALEYVAQNTDDEIIVGARDAQKIPSYLKDKITVLPLELASLASVNSFCSDVRSGEKIEALILNAGLSPRSIVTTEDGYDQAFQVNYLSHFAIVQKLLAELSDDALVMITSSGTHDPEEKTPPPPPNHANAKRLAYPEQDPDLDKRSFKRAARSYTSSKLCCTMLSLSLAERYPSLSSISFDPGLVPGTGLTREFPQLLVKILMPFMSRSMPADRTGTLETSAMALANYMMGKHSIGKSGDYIAMRGGVPVSVAPSHLARTRELRDALWSDSLELLKHS